MPSDQLHYGMRNVLLLALSQAALMTSISLVLASSVVIGANLATPALATLPLAMQYLGPGWPLETAPPMAGQTAPGRTHELCLNLGLRESGSGFF